MRLTRLFQRTAMLERRLSGRIAPTYDHHVLIESLVTFAINVRHMGELLSRHREIIWRAEVAGRDNDGLRARFALAVVSQRRTNEETVTVSLYGRHAFVLTQRDIEMADHRPIVRQRIASRWLLGRNYKGNVAERKLFRSREKAHVGRVMRDGAYHGLRLDYNDA